MRTGLHTNNAHDHAKIIDYYRRSGSTVFKALNIHDDLVTELRGMGVTIIGRVHEQDQRLSGDKLKAFHSKLRQAVKDHPGVQFWEGFNEEFADPSQIGKYAQVEIDRMKMLEDLGVRAAIGCFSQGTPALQDDPDPAKRKSWELFRPALEYALPRGHMLELHEYAGPYMQFGCIFPNGKNRWNHTTNSFTGMSTEGIWSTTLRGYHTLRYRLVYDQLRSWGLGDLPLFIGEGGIDDTWPRPGGQGRGYKAHAGSEWAKFPGIGDYADQRRWYMWQASHDRFVHGVVDFGWEGTMTGWPDFDLSTDPAMVDRIITREADLPVGHFGAPSPTPPPVTPPQPPPPPPPEAKMLQGIDVSRWQGPMDWSKAKAAGTVYAWIKASEGSSWVDPRFMANARDAAANGILWGAYHYYRNDIDPLAQAQHFVSTVAAAGVSPTLTYALDFEDTTGTLKTAAMATFAYEVERLTGVKPIVYTARWWWTPARLGGRQEWAARLPLWIADYSPESVPLPATGEWSKWTILQYTSSGSGSLYGAGSDRIDLNHFAGTRDALIATVGYNKPTGIDLARLWHEAQENQAIRLNPDSAIQKAMAAAGKVPIGNEWSFSPDEQAQLAESLAGTGAAVFVWDRRDGKVTRYNQP